MGRPKLFCRGCFRRNCCGPIPVFCGPATASIPPQQPLAASLCRGYRAHGRTGNFRFSATARRRHPARAIRWKIASCFRARCPRSSGSAMWSGWRRSFRRCGIRWLSLAPTNHDNPARRPADSRPLQRNLFRAFLSRALSGLSAGARQRSDGARRHRVRERRWKDCGAWM